MAKANYIKLDEAAEKLGISPDKLKEMIDNNDIRAFRDGASFKFKTDEIDRVKATLGDVAEAADDAIQLADDSLDELVPVDGILDDDDSADSLLVDEQAGGSATVIGDSGTPSAADSDLKLASGSDLGLSIDDDEIELTAADSAVEKAASSEISLDAPATSGDSDVLGGDPEITLSGSDTGVLAAGGGSDLELKLEDDDSLDLTEDVPGEDSVLKLSGDDDASIDLDDEDLVLGSGVGSDVTLGGGDSGINLTNPADSGLSLEDESLNLSDDDSLDLDDDDMLTLDGDDLGSDEPADLQTDDDFLLTPVEDAADDESDSGSQVIALDSEEFDDSAATMLNAEEADLGDALVEDVDGGGFEEAAVAAAAAPVAASALAAAPAEEADFSIWNILSLACLLVLMCLAGVMMMDVIKNIWSWDNAGGGGISSAIMDPLANLLN